MLRSGRAFDFSQSAFALLLRKNILAKRHTYIVHVHGHKLIENYISFKPF